MCDAGVDRNVTPAEEASGMPGDVEPPVTLAN